MQINTITIRNYRSIKELSLKDFGKCNVFIGKNNSGKTNIINALRLVFEHLSDGVVSKDLVSGSNARSIWYYDLVEEPVIFCVDFTLDSSESNKLANQFSANFGLKSVTLFAAHIEVRLILQDSKLIWTINDFKVNFSTSNSENLEEIKESMGFIQSEKGFLLPIVKEQQIIHQELFSEVCNLIKGKIVHISSDRWHKTSYEEKFNGLNESILSDSAQSTTNKLAESYVWREFQRFRNFFKNTQVSYTRTYDNRIAKNNCGVEFPRQDFGSGDQYVEYLLSMLLGNAIRNKDSVILIEEPEIHLHLQYIQALADVITDVSQRDIQFFIVTHSPELVRSVLPKQVNIFHVKPKYDEINNQVFTEAEHFNKDVDPDLIDARYLFNDLVIFVEGDSDRKVFQRCIQLHKEELPNLDKLTYTFDTIAESYGLKKPIVLNSYHFTKIAVIVDKHAHWRESDFKKLWEQNAFAVKLKEDIILMFDKLLNNDEDYKKYLAIRKEEKEETNLGELKKKLVEKIITALTKEQMPDEIAVCLEKLDKWGVR